MADKKANLILTLKDEASAGLSKLKASFVAVGAAVAGVTAFLVDSFKAYAASEVAVNKLNVALKNQGIYSKALSQDLQNFASDLQKMTTFEDEAIIETQALLTTFGLTGDQLKQTTKAALDLSTGLGIDLKSATMLLGKAFVGETGSLSRYGITIADNIPQAEKFTAVMDQLNQRFGGAAQAQLNTMTGKFENMKNRLGELKEQIGAELIPVFESWMGWAEKILGMVEKITGAKRNELTVNQLAIEQLIIERDALIEQAQQRALNHDGIVRLTEADQARILMITDQLNVLRNAHQQELIMNQGKVVSAQAKSNQISNIEKKEVDERIKRAIKQNQDLDKENIRHNAEFIKGKEAAAKMAMTLEAQKAQNFESTLQFIASLSTSHNKTLAVIGKASAIALAQINTARAITLALASSPPPFNFALAAAVGAAGAAQIATIAGVKLARGGIVMPSAGGIQATIGEGGNPEAVLPLGSDRANEQLREAGIGSGPTVNISVGTLVGSDGMKEFAKIIDQELFALRRNNESVAFEAI